MSARLSVLVAEPEAIARRLTLRLLERLGHAVETVATAGEALAAAGRGAYDVVLVTRDEDGLDPAEVARALRAQGRRGVVVAVAEHVSPGDEHRWREAGVDWLTKPVRVEPLARLVERLAVRLGGLGDSATAAAGPAPRPQAPPGLAVQEMLDTRFRDAAPFYAEMLAVFAETSAEPLARMRTALAAGAWDDLRAAAHFVKGGALTVGADAAADQARALEDWARALGASGARGEGVDTGRLTELQRTIGEIERFATQFTQWVSAAAA